jgi:hypothetical protein
MLLKNVQIENLQESRLGTGNTSLVPLAAYLHKILGSEGGRRHLLPWFGLEMIKGVEQKHGEMGESNMEPYEGVFEMIHSLQDGLRLEEKGLWGLGYPIPQQAFYGTSEFYAFIESDARIISEDKKTGLSPIQQLLYSVILERFYEIPTSTNMLLYKLEQESVDHYYELGVDFSFVDIQPKGKLPVIDLTTLRDKDEYCLEDLEPVFQLLDPDKFTFSGFTILTLEDKTAAYVSDWLHTMIANLSQYKEEQFFGELHKILSTIAGSKEILSSLLPVLELNGYPILTSDFTRDSIFFRELQKRNISGVIDPATTAYLEKPYPVLYGIEKSLDTEDRLFRELIEREGLASYISIPLKHQQSLVGFLELYSYVPNRLDKTTMMIWKTFIPLLTQLTAEIVFLFKNSLERVILNNFTALNPAVEWRFNEVAAGQLAAYIRKEEKPPMDKVRFEKVYPIYGAIDVKGSTQLRNRIYRKDNLSKIDHLEHFLETLPLDKQEDLIAGLRRRTGKMRNWLEATDYEKHMLDVFSFLHEELFEILESIKAENPVHKSAIEIFVNQQKGLGGNHTDDFETSLQQLNYLIKDEVRQFNATVQDVFPSYFELFRSDGIEYDMYVGQSITPTKAFEPSFLREIRKQQIISMARIGKRAAEVATSLVVPMQVTLLIFVHTSTIDISFREDERRFDVEGGYNIRYQMVKKRIDKVRIKNSKERLVRPNTLAIVFQGDTLEMEIGNLLTEVVASGLLKPDFEICTLEEIQGVSELQAVRADIVLNEG